MLYTLSIAQYTASAALLLFKLNPAQEKKIDACLFNTKALDIRNNIWRLVHLLPSTLFLFLFGLSLRNKFKIR